MAADRQKTQEMTHVRAAREKRDRAKEVARRTAAKESRDVHYTYVIDEILEEGLARREKKLGIVI